MSETRDDPAIFWVDPMRRGIIPLDGFHISRSLARRMRRGGYDRDAESRFHRGGGCLRGQGRNLDQHRNPTPVHRAARNGPRAFTGDMAGRHPDGGVYGLCLGGAFFGESMFSPAPTPRNWRSRTWSIICGAAVSCCSTRSSSPRIWPRLAPSRWIVPTIAGVCRRRSGSRPIWGATRSVRMAPRSGIATPRHRNGDARARSTPGKTRSSSPQIRAAPHPWG